MTTIAYYISDYGFGHAARSIAIIRKLLERIPTVRIIICTSYPMNFIKQSLISYPNVEYRIVRTDIGYVLVENSLEPDIAKLNQVYDHYVAAAPDQISQETDFLMDEKVRLVLSDITPIPFLCADRLGIPSIGISNFTWYTAYKNWISEIKLQFLQNAYCRMDHFFALAGADEPQWGSETNRTFGFFSRKVDAFELETIRINFKNNLSKPLVYVGFGMKADIQPLHSWKIWDNKKVSFVISSSHPINHPNVSIIPVDYIESQHYIAAADLVITKAGWGTVSEAVCYSKPLLIVGRSAMQEDVNTIRYLQKNHLCELIQWETISDLAIDPEAIRKRQWECQHQDISLDQTNEIINAIIQIIELNNCRRMEIA
jgi:uncharacterized protein (TIGR00661 family)